MPLKNIGHAPTHFWLSLPQNARHTGPGTSEGTDTSTGPDTATATGTADVSAETVRDRLCTEAHANGGQQSQGSDAVRWGGSVCPVPGHRIIDTCKVKSPGALYFARGTSYSGIWCTNREAKPIAPKPQLTPGIATPVPSGRTARARQTRPRGCHGVRWRGHVSDKSDALRRLDTNERGSVHAPHARIHPHTRQTRAGGHDGECTRDTRLQPARPARRRR